MSKTYRSYEDYIDEEACEECGKPASLILKGLYLCKKCARLARKPNHEYEIEEDDRE
jgi:ribosomal protein S14